MLDCDGNIIYIGKAVNLKNRVRQYFRSNIADDKVRAMVSHIADFRYILTNNEVDALVLEANLIKKHKPLYNILLKDDKDYPFIKINMRESFPAISIVRRLSDDGALYFGPYMRGISVNDLTDIIEAAFLLRKCKNSFKARKRACLNFHLGRCLAPCMGAVSEKEYKKEIKKVIDFLRGNEKYVADILNTKMLLAAENEDFENALYYREKLKALDKIVRNQITAIPKDLNADIFAFVSDGENACVAMLCVRGGRMCGGDNFPFEKRIANSGEGLSSFLAQYYINSAPPDEVIINVSSARNLIGEFFSSRGEKVKVWTPQKAIRKDLLKMCIKNGAFALEKLFVKREKENSAQKAVSQLAEILNIPNIRRMEAYDISNISGTDKVASMVVFVDGEANHAHYRRFKIKTVKGADDFACMAETLKRRLFEMTCAKDISFGEVPDLIVIDGGKGQLSAAYAALSEYSLNTHMIGLAKREEEVFVPNCSAPIIIPHTFPALKLLQKIRDEAHRFAVTYHRKLRADRMSRSVLLKIDGLGEKGIEKLYRSFKSLDNIKNASTDELVKSGINKTVAEKIFEFFRKGDIEIEI